MKLTPELINARILRTTFAQVEDTTTTICVIQMVNGFTVVGKSACIDVADFDAEKGKQIAYQDAFEKLWELEGYLAIERRHQAKLPAMTPATNGTQA